MNTETENEKTPDERMVLIHGFSREETIAIMRAAKSVASDPQGIAFTTSTPSNIEWKLRDVIAEVREEHEYMRNNPPQANRSKGSSQAHGGAE
ncbi:MAG: DUF3783 domain-containing protein [Spirochaetia bacterium]|nr:DUF3783 domain-containing protein [Spirochaetia bacterium]